MQHGIFNGSSLLPLVPGVGDRLDQPWYLGALPDSLSTFIAFGLYIIIFGVLIYVTGRLAPGQRSAAGPAQTGSSDGAPSEALAGGVR